MSTPIKEKRNKDLVKKRKSNPKKWTWGELAKFYGIKRPTVVQIYNRWKNIY